MTRPNSFVLAKLRVNRLLPLMFEWSEPNYADLGLTASGVDRHGSAYIFDENASRMVWKFTLNKVDD